MVAGSVGSDTGRMRKHYTAVQRGELTSLVRGARVHGTRWHLRCGQGRPQCGVGAPNTMQRVRSDTCLIAVPTSYAALYTQLAELSQRIDDEIAQADGGAIDYGAIEQRIADALGEVERGLHAQVLARLEIGVPAIRAGSARWACLREADSR